MKIGARGSVEQPFDKFRPSPLILLIIWFLRNGKELPLSLNITVEDSPCVLSHTSQTVLFCWAKLFFFASRTFTWYYYCIRNQSGCGKPEATGQMRARPHSLSLPWHGIAYKIWRFQSERLTTMLISSNYECSRIWYITLHANRSTENKLKR